MQDRVFDAADILIDRQPLIDFGANGGARDRADGEAREVPGEFDEGVERVGLAPRLAAALRAVTCFQVG